jgi:hypothetical protein
MKCRINLLNYAVAGIVGIILKILTPLTESLKNPSVTIGKRIDISLSDIKIA